MIKNLILFFIFIFIFACKSTNSEENQLIQKNGDLYRIETFEVDSGWGYLIYINDKVYIEQKMIPAVNGIFVFDSEKNAEIVGIYVMKKLVDGQRLPSVNYGELDSLGVLYEEVIEYQKIDFGTKTGIKPGK